MRMGRFTRALAQSLAAVMFSPTAGPALAQSHDHPGIVSVQPHKPTPQENELVQAVRDATEKFKNVTNVAGPGEGYELNFGCVSGGEFGAMGLHYVNLALFGDGEIKADQPDHSLRADAWRRHPHHRGGLHRGRGGLGFEPPAHRTAAAEGSAVPFLRQTEPIWTRRVLYASRVGVEGQSQRHIHQLESECVLRRVQSTYAARALIAFHPPFSV